MDNIINNYNNYNNYNTFLALGHCSIPVSYDISCFSYNQSLSVINCIYSAIWIKLTKHQHTLCVQIASSYEIDSIQTIMIYVLHVQFYKHRNNSIWCILPSTCSTQYALSVILLSQLTFMYWPNNGNQLHIYT